MRDCAECRAFHCYVSVLFDSAVGLRLGIWVCEKLIGDGRNRRDAGCCFCFGFVAECVGTSCGGESAAGDGRGVCWCIRHSA